MKRTKHNTYLILAFLVFALAGTLSACVSDIPDPEGRFGPNGSLTVKGTVSEATVATRAESVVELQEKQLNTLDIFIEHVTSGVGDGTFINQYHLVTTNETPIAEAANNWLADNWRAEGLSSGQYYNIYVAVNNSHTKDTKNLETFDVAALKVLEANEVEEGVAILDNDDNIGWGETTTSGNIYKLYDAAPGSWRALTDEKEFMMDGVIKNWTPNTETLDQVFDVTLNRAAAKIVLNVKFDAKFLKSLTYNMKVEGTDTTWTLKPAAEQVTITGSPAWKFYNFAFGAPVFAPATQGAGVEVHNSGFNIFHNQSYTGDDKHFQIITYTYPNKWAQADYATAAPSLVISVGFTENGVTNYHYYRIPLVKSTVTEIERNHIYVINATIATRGSEATEDQDVTEDIEYAVLHWNDQSNSDVIENHVEAVQHLYLKVNPKIYTLRGDGSQSVDITYLKATGTQVKYQLFTFDSNGNKGNAVDPSNANAVWGWFYDKNGKVKTTYTNLNHMGVTIAQSTEGTSGSKGTITVTSSALDNRAIKYMLLRVYLVDSPTLYEDVIIRHFPTDNIQSFTGSWSSYHTGGSTREDTWDPVAAGWEPGTYESEEVEVSSTDPYDRSEVLYDGTPSNHDSGTDYRYDYSTGQNGSTVQTQYRNNVAQGRARYDTNGETNAVLGADGYWYWGETRNYYSNNGNDYDWRANNNGNYNANGSRRYRWTNYYRSKYKKTHYYRTRYYRIVTVTTPDTGNWVDWDRDHNHSGTAKWVVRSSDPLYTDTRFHAHVWSDADGHVHEINSSNNNMATQGDQTGSGHTNNHMYVVQISATSDKYVLGKPILGNPGPNQSMDEVVSPAFMIASQLGVVSTGWDPASAAEHCSRYLEVGTDGYRYAGWRLPTDDEIQVINQYQRGIFGNITIPEAERVMDYVLRGHYYYNLSGGTTTITAYTGGDGNYLRCIRDLSAEEIENLNGFDAIVEKYRNH
ncbi:MAG: hypothetical protein IKX60_00435 [Bacteroidales bacterium]|nr:hypothetical protein [Bacteroidales bacterium]